MRALAFIFAVLSVALEAHPQEQAENWQRDIRRFVAVQNWDEAFRVVDAVLTRLPADIEARAWHARLLLWSGRLEAAESEFLALTAAAPGDPDVWQGLASTYARQGRWDDALRTLDRAVEMAPDRSDLRIARAQALRALNRPDEARQEYQTVLKMNSSIGEARAGLLSVRPALKQELRFGTDTELFNYTGAYEGEWVSLASRWSPHWRTSVAGNYYQRSGPAAGKFVGSVTASAPRWGALTAGGAAAHDNDIIPKNEAFFGLDRGWRLSENGFVRGVEATYDQYWYWYSSARILALTGGALFYLPREWSWSLRVTAARNTFPALPVEWRPSGVTRLGFPLAHWGERRMEGNLSFAAGTEDFALADQLGRFSSRTFGGGWRFQFNRRLDVTGYAAYQQRTQGRTQTSFGFTYAIRF